MDLTKRDKKVARELIDKGYRTELNAAFVEVARVIQKWKDKDPYPSDVWDELRNVVRKNNKYLELRYGALTGSHYYSTVLTLLIGGIINENDLDAFSDVIKQSLKESKVPWDRTKVTE